MKKTMSRCSKGCLIYEPLLVQNRLVVDCVTRSAEKRTNNPDVTDSRPPVCHKTHIDGHKSKLVAYYGNFFTFLKIETLQMHTEF